jgi:hypothetical protein
LHGQHVHTISLKIKLPVFCCILKLIVETKEFIRLITLHARNTEIVLRFVFRFMDVIYINPQRSETPIDDSPPFPHLHTTNHAVDHFHIERTNYLYITVLIIDWFSFVISGYLIWQ